MDIIYMAWAIFSYIIALHWSIVSVFVLLGLIGVITHKKNAKSKPAIQKD